MILSYTNKNYLLASWVSYQPFKKELLHVILTGLPCTVSPHSLFPSVPLQTFSTLFTVPSYMLFVYNILLNVITLTLTILCTDSIFWSSQLCNFLHPHVTSCFFFFFSPLALWSMQGLGLLQYNFQASLTVAVFLKPVIPIFFRSFSTLSNHLLLGFPTAHCHSGTSYFYVYIFPSALYSHTPSNCKQLQAALPTEYCKLNTTNSTCFHHLDHPQCFFNVLYP